MKLNERQWLAVFSLLGLVYLGLRFWNLTASCLWFDEIFSVHAAEHDWGSLVWFVAQDLIHPPLFYAILKIWIAIGGESLFWLRFFPVVFSVLALIPFYLLSRELKLKNSTIALALLFVAVNGGLVKYAQEVRMYSLLFFLSLVSLWLFARFFNGGKGLWALAAINILLVYTHYFGWLVILSEALSIVFLQRSKLRHILIMTAAAVLSFTPWLYALWQASKINSDVGQNLGWMSRPTASVVFQFALDLVEPFFFQQSSDEPASRFLITIPLLLIVVAAKLFYLFGERDKASREVFYLLSIFAAAPLLTAFAASWILPVSIWGSRHLIVVFAPALLLCAVFLTEIRDRRLKISLLSLLSPLLIGAFILQVRSGQPKFIWCAWEDLAKNIEPSQEEQKIYVFEDLTAYHFWFALRKNENAVQIIKVKGVEGLEEDAAYFLPRGFEEVQIVDETKIEGERVRLAFRDNDWDEKKPPLRNLLQRGYLLDEPVFVEVKGLKAFLVRAKK